MGIVARLLLVLATVFILNGCGPKQLIYEGPTPTVEKKLYNEKSCN